MLYRIIASGLFTKNKHMFEKALKEYEERVIIKSPTKISNTCLYYMTEDEYKIKIIEMVNTVTDIKILRRIFLIIVTIIGGSQ